MRVTSAGFVTQINERTVFGRLRFRKPFLPFLRLTPTQIQLNNFLSDLPAKALACAGATELVKHIGCAKVPP